MNQSLITKWGMQVSYSSSVAYAAFIPPNWLIILQGGHTLFAWIFWIFLIKLLELIFWLKKAIYLFISFLVMSTHGISLNIMYKKI